jgi:hypothetical protein
MTAEVAGSLVRGTRKHTLIIPMAERYRRIDAGSIVAVLEPFHYSFEDGDLTIEYQAFAPKPRQWSQACDMDLTSSRLSFVVDSSDHISVDEVSIPRMLADGVYKVGHEFKWHVLRQDAPVFRGITQAWLNSFAVNWGLYPMHSNVIVLTGKVVRGNALYVREDMVNG